MKYDTPASCRFFSPDDAVRWALAAYYGASRALTPPPGEAFIQERVPWATPASFALDVHFRFTDSIVAAAIAAKVPCDHGTASATCGWDLSSETGSPDFMARQERNNLPGVLNLPDTRQNGGARGG